MMRMEGELSGGELAFGRRMLQRFLAGKSVEEAAAAVIDDDARLAAAFFKRRSSHYMPTYDERGRSHRNAEQIGDVIASELSARVYAALIAQDKGDEA